jgi:hypothetical protein
MGVLLMSRAENFSGLFLEIATANRESDKKSSNSGLGKRSSGNKFELSTKNSQQTTIYMAATYTQRCLMRRDTVHRKGSKQIYALKTCFRLKIFSSFYPTAVIPLVYFVTRILVASDIGNTKVEAPEGGRPWASELN